MCLWLALSSSSSQLQFDKPDNQDPDQRRRKSRDDVSRVMHTEIDSRQANQQKRRCTHDPDQHSRAPRFDSRRKNRRERAKEAGARQRVSTGKAVSLRRR